MLSEACCVFGYLKVQGRIERKTCHMDESHERIGQENTGTTNYCLVFVCVEGEGNDATGFVRKIFF
jgi:hypothetical protein